MNRPTEHRTTVERAARAGLWLLPGYGVLLGLSTLTHQPPVDDFDAYARYVTTDVFLVSHLGASIFGAALAILGAVAVTAFLVRGRAAGAAVTGLALTAVANVFLAAAFGSAAFVQPGVGRAHLDGVAAAEALNADTAYGTPLLVTALATSVVFIVAAIVTGTAIARTSPALRYAGIAYAVLLPLFVVSGFLLHTLQPIAGFAFAAATSYLALRLPRVSPSAATTGAGGSGPRLVAG